jgi:hypothetical protein
MPREAQVQGSVKEISREAHRISPPSLPVLADRPRQASEIVSQSLGTRDYVHNMNQSSLTFTI